MYDFRALVISQVRMGIIMMHHNNTVIMPIVARQPCDRPVCVPDEGVVEHDNYIRELVFILRTGNG